MKDIKKENGMITIEASLSFILFMFLILFIYCFSNIYIAQNQVGHMAIQANETIALESYGREKLSEQTLVKDANNVLETVNSISSTFFSTSLGLQTADLVAIGDLTDSNFKKLYQKVAAQSLVDASNYSYTTDAKEKLEHLGIDTETMKFDVKLSPSATGSGTDIVTVITYDVRLQFPFMGKDKIPGIKKQAKSKLFTTETINKSYSWVGM